MVKLVSNNSNLCDHNSQTLQTDRQTTCNRNTALCTKVHRAVTYKDVCRKKSYDRPDGYKNDSSSIKLDNYHLLLKCSYWIVFSVAWRHSVVATSRWSQTLVADSCCTVSLQESWGRWRVELRSQPIPDSWRTYQWLRTGCSTRRPPLQPSLDSRNRP